MTLKNANRIYTRLKHNGNTIWYFLVVKLLSRFLRKASRILSSDRIEQQPSKLRAAGSNPAECALVWYSLLYSANRDIKIQEVFTFCLKKSGDNTLENSRIFCHIASNFHQ